jgi:hypothetical protein
MKWQIVRMGSFFLAVDSEIGNARDCRKVRCAVYNGILGSDFGQKFPTDQRSIPADGDRDLTPTLRQSRRHR